MDKIANPFSYHNIKLKDKQDSVDSIRQGQKAFREEITSYNNLLGYRMRYCTRCGVGIGLMTYKTYNKRYMDTSCLCERCAKVMGG